MAYEKDNEGFTLDRDLNTHIIASVEKALDRAGVTKALTDISASLKTIATNTGTTASNTTNIRSSVASIDGKIDEN